jgi:UDP-N-acetyl-2-amino-2-deoxyglucuronate dehydrogenase
MSPIITPVKNRKIKLGFVGCGRISGKHFDALEQHIDDIEIISVCDIIKERAKSAAGRMKATPYTDLEEMLENEKLDIVTIATPNGLHKEHVIKAADARIHVITEKPMAIKLSDGIKMQKRCLEKGVQLFVIHQNRFNDTAQEIWKACKAKRFGRIYMITSNVFWTRPQEYYDKEGDWHGTKDIDGGAFYTQASHYIDFMEWIANAAPKTVYANLKTLALEIETEDTGIANIEWENGIMGAINMTMLTYPKNLEGSVTIIGEKGTVRIGGVAMNKIEHWEFADNNPHDKNIMNANYETTSVYGFGHVRYYENIINVFRGNEKPLIDGNEGLKSLKLLEGIYKSSKKGKPINIKEL